MSHEASDFGPITDYGESMTKQAFKDSTDINKIIRKAQKQGSLEHALKYPAAVYGEFTGVDLLGAFQQVERAQAIFDECPSEVRREFDNDAFKFMAFASDPENIDRLPELLPQLAEPGDFRFPKPGDEAPPSQPEKAAKAGPKGTPAELEAAPEEPPAASEPSSST